MSFCVFVYLLRIKHRSPNGQLLVWILIWVIPDVIPSHRQDGIHRVDTQYIYIHIPRSTINTYNSHSPYRYLQQCTDHIHTISHPSCPTKYVHYIYTKFTWYIHYLYQINHPFSLDLRVESKVGWVLPRLLRHASELHLRDWRHTLRRFGEAAVSKFQEAGQLLPRFVSWGRTGWGWLVPWWGFRL